MRTARDEYYEFKKHADINHEGLRDPIENYVTELEQENKELREDVRAEQRMRLCNKIDELEQEKEELIGFLIKCRDAHVDYEELCRIIHKHTEATE